MADRDFSAQLRGYSLTTAEILYWMPDHRHVLQSFVWQNLDLAPRFPRLTKFLDFWERNLATLQAARASAVFSRFDQQVVALTVVTSVANAWFSALAVPTSSRP